MNTEANAAPAIGVAAIVLDCPDMEALSDFYIRLLGWERDYFEEGEYLSIRSPQGGVRLGFQQNPDYVAPVWPEEPGKQQQMLHIDFSVSGSAELDSAVRHAISCGASRAPQQFSDEWAVLLDPVGHPFCFVVW